DLSLDSKTGGGRVARIRCRPPSAGGRRFHRYADADDQPTVRSPRRDPFRWTRFFGGGGKTGGGGRALAKGSSAPRISPHSPHPGGRHLDGPSGAGRGGPPRVGNPGDRCHWKQRENDDQGIDRCRLVFPVSGT